MLYFIGNQRLQGEHVINTGVRTLALQSVEQIWENPEPEASEMVPL